MASYCRPRTVSEVLAALAGAEGHGRILVGGTDLLVHLRKDPFAPTVVVDIKSVNDFPPAVEIGADAVRFGPTARMSEISNATHLLQTTCLRWAHRLVSWDR